MSRPRQARPDYGVDAPGLVRGMVLAGGACLLARVAADLGAWPARPLGLPLSDLVACPAAYFLGMGGFMIYSSKVGKLRAREALLDLVPWDGREDVLDVGCGRGLMLVGSALRLAGGKAIGVDLWREADQAGNRPEAALENARREGVEGRVEVRTADMRQLPFPDRSFDRVLSHWAVHNLEAEADRAQALREMARVLKPGGFLVLGDIRNHAECAALLAQLGLEGVRLVGSLWSSVILAVLTLGSFRPAAVVARKPT